MSKWRKRSGEMEGFYLLCSIASNTITSSLLSLLLAVRSLAAPHRRPSDTDAAAAVRLYEGRVRHVRLRPVHNAFEYPVKYAFIDLDLAPQLSHFSADRAREVAATNGPVFLLTIPASVGYEQNPLSVYYCYDVGRGGEEEDGAPPPCLKTCIAEVTNTPWGERVTFLFNPSSDLVAKPLHVSPFMDMLGNWSIRADAPGENLFLAISVQHPTLGNYFTATLSAKRIHSLSSSRNLAIYFWLMPHKVAMWIYWQGYDRGGVRHRRSRRSSCRGVIIFTADRGGDGVRAEEGARATEESGIGGRSLCRRRRKGCGRGRDRRWSRRRMELDNLKFFCMTCYYSWHLSYGGKISHFCSIQCTTTQCIEMMP